MKRTKLEKEILDLPAAEREQVALVAWESLANDAEFVANRNFDPEGIDVAYARNDEIESGRVKPINHSEFQRRTSHDNK